MYHKHNTQGIVINGFDNGEYNKVLSIFTSEFGLVYVRAQNVRNENSKLRFGVQDFTLGQFSLVKGRNGWRLVGAEAEKELYVGLDSWVKKKTMASVLSLLRRLTDEEKNEELYQLMVEFLESLERAEGWEVASLETFFVLRMLENLGVLQQRGALSTLDLETVRRQPSLAVSLVNESLKSL